MLHRPVELARLFGHLSEKPVLRPLAKEIDPAEWLDECLGLWLLKNSSTEDSRKIHRAGWPTNDFLGLGRHFLLLDFRPFAQKTSFSTPTRFCTHRRSDALRLLFPKVLSYSNLYPACTETPMSTMLRIWSSGLRRSVVVFSLCKAKLFGRCGCGSFLFGA